jgi:tRNA-splicing ligase RtcB
MEGVVCRADKDVLDEAPWVYKNIGGVLSAQEGVLIEVTDHFKPVIVLKG